MEAFENAAGAGAQLLKAERLAQAGADESTPAAAYLFTFDVGRILLTADPAHGRLVGTPIPDQDSLPGGMVDASEDEPWWRLLGCSLAQVSPAADRTSLQLDFRISGGALRSLDLELTGGAIRARLVAVSR